MHKKKINFRFILVLIKLIFSIFMFKGETKRNTRCPIVNIKKRKKQNTKIES